MIIIDIIDDTDAKTEKPRRTTPTGTDLTGRGLLALLRTLNRKKLPAPDDKERQTANHNLRQMSSFALQQHTEAKPTLPEADE